jgi:threonine/homoserine/homoserine lactone efflux protein
MPPDLWPFLIASVLLTLAPGPDILFVITQGVVNGRRAAIITALGLCSGVIAHTSAAALGVSAIFHSSPMAFALLKYAGASYLLYLAWQAIKHRKQTLAGVGRQSLKGGDLFRRGLLMNLLNPKVSLFFLAFLPQFVDPAAASVPLQMMILGSLFMLQAIVIFCLIGVGARIVAGRLLQHPRAPAVVAWGSAGIFAGLGLRLAFLTP